jgi:hypothetical protein
MGMLLWRPWQQQVLPSTTLSASMLAFTTERTCFCSVSFPLVYGITYATIMTPVALLLQLLLLLLLLLLPLTRTCPLVLQH